MMFFVFVNPDGVVVEPGDTIKNFRGDEWVFVRLAAVPDGPQVEVQSSRLGEHPVFNQTFYPSVFPGYKIVVS